MSKNDMDELMKKLSQLGFTASTWKWRDKNGRWFGSVSHETDRGFSFEVRSQGFVVWSSWWKCKIFDSQDGAIEYIKERSI